MCHLHRSGSLIIVYVTDVLLILLNFLIKVLSRMFSERNSEALGIVHLSVNKKIICDTKEDCESSAAVIHLNKFT